MIVVVAAEERVSVLAAQQPVVAKLSVDVATIVVGCDPPGSSVISLELSDGTRVTPFGGDELIWNFAGESGASGAGGENIGTLAVLDAGPSGVRGRVELGIKASTLSGHSVDFSGSYDGIGAGDYNAVTGQAAGRVPLN